MERYQELSTELATVAAGLDSLADNIARTEIERNLAQQAAADIAVAAYMEALAMPAQLMLQSDTIEEALVAQRTLEFLAGDEDDTAAALSGTKRDLEVLSAEYQERRTEVQEIQAEVDAEATLLQELFTTADQSVASAIADALVADAAYRQALDRVQRARAAEEERKRQQARATTTTATSPLATGDNGSTTTTTPRPLRPAVEQWRGLVAQFFSAEMVEPALRIMQCESLGDPKAYNPYSGASGLFQFLPGTWAITSPKAGYQGASPFDPEANTASAAWVAGLYQRLGKNPWAAWSCKP
jgi:hypothetical protein